MKKRFRETISLGEAMKKVLEQSGIEQKVKLHLLLESWEDVAGKTIAKRTKKVSYFPKDKTLVIELADGLDAMETMYLKKSIRIKINKFLGDNQKIRRIKIL